MNIEPRPMESIRANEPVSRDNEAALGAIAASLRQFGFSQPIVMDAVGVFVIGHTL